MNKFENGRMKAQNEIDIKELMQATARDHITRETKETYIIWDKKSNKVVTVPK